MPLTQKQQECLKSIKGENGIISTIGIVGNKLKLSRGEITQGNLLKDNPLDILAKVFFKADVDIPIYTSLIHNLSHDVIVISYVGAPKDNKTNTVRALTEGQVNNLITQLLQLQNSGNIENSKVGLFKEMYKCGNEILQDKLVNMVPKERQKDLKRQKNNSDFYDKVQSYYYKDTVKGDEVLDDPLFMSFVLKNFDKILPNIENALFLLNYMNSNLIINTEIPQYEGVHVEVKGIHFVKEKYPNATEFNIGLAKRDIDPGCCTGCATEFTAFAKVYEHSFNRTGDFDCNFPPAVNYQPSPLVTSESGVFKEFTQNISSRIKAQIRELKAQNTSIDAQILNTRIEELNQNTVNAGAQIEELKTRIKELKTRIEELKAQDISNTGTQIEELKTQIEELKAQDISNTRAQIRELNAQIRELKTQGISTQIEELEKLNAQIGELHRTIKTNKEEQKQALQVLDQIQAVENVENHEFFTIFAEMIAEDLPGNNVFNTELSDFV